MTSWISGTVTSGARARSLFIVSTAGDLATFFGSLDPAAKRSVLTTESRRAMQHRQWKDPYGRGPSDIYYGLGMILGGSGDWEWAGHAGVFPSALSYSYSLTGRDLSFSIPVSYTHLTLPTKA